MDPDERLYSLYRVGEFRGIVAEELMCWDMTLEEAYAQIGAQSLNPDKMIIREQRTLVGELAATLADAIQRDVEAQASAEEVSSPEEKK